MQPPMSAIKNKEFKWDKYCNMIAIIVYPASGPRLGLKVKHHIKTPVPWTNINVTHHTAPPLKIWRKTTSRKNQRVLLIAYKISIHKQALW